MPRSLINKPIPARNIRTARYCAGVSPQYRISERFTPRSVLLQKSMANRMGAYRKHQVARKKPGFLALRSSTIKTPAMKRAQRASYRPKSWRIPPGSPAASQLAGPLVGWPAGRPPAGLPPAGQPPGRPAARAGQSPSWHRTRTVGLSQMERLLQSCPPPPCRRSHHVLAPVSP